MRHHPSTKPRNIQYREHASAILVLVLVLVVHRVLLAILVTFNPEVRIGGLRQIEFEWFQNGMAGNITIWQWRACRGSGFSSGPGKGATGHLLFSTSSWWIARPRTLQFRDQLFLCMLFVLSIFLPTYSPECKSKIPTPNKLRISSIKKRSVQ